MSDRYPLSSSQIEALSTQLQNQAQAYTQARLSRGVDDGNFDVAAAREALSRTHDPDAVLQEWSKASLGGVPIYKSPKKPGPILLFIHGGGFVGGSWESHGHICDHISRMVCAETVFIDYRLAPEHPFPAAYEDVEAVFRAIPKDRPILLAGDSVGGALSLHLARLDRTEQTGRIKAVALMAAMLDFDVETSFYLKNYGRARSMIANAIAADQTEDPRLKILGDDQQDLPPILIQTGGADYVQDDGHRLARALQNANGAVVIEHWPHMPHVWHRYTPNAPEAFNAVSRAGTFLLDHIGRL